MSVSKVFEIEDREYEIDTDSFTRGHAGSYWEPPDGSEWCPMNVVGVTWFSESDEIVHEDVVTWETFLLEFAVYHKISLDKAEDKITEAMIEACEEYAADRECDE